MAQVPNNHHLLRRNGVYNYRRKVPPSLLAEFGTVIQFSLKTSDPKQARQQRELCDIEWSARFSEACKILHGDNVSPTSRKLSRADAERLVKDYVEQS